MTDAPSEPTGEGVSPYGSPRSDEVRRRIRIHHLQEMKDRGERWPMLTAYDKYAAAVFDEIGMRGWGAAMTASRACASSDANASETVRTSPAGMLYSLSFAINALVSKRLIAAASSGSKYAE